MENKEFNFKKQSRTGLWMSVMGVIVMCISIILFITLVNDKEDVIVEQTAALEQKDSLTKQLVDTIQTIKKQVIADKILCEAELLKEKMQDGSALYMFTLRVNDSLSHNYTKAEYFFDHPSYRPKIKWSDKAEDHFAISYKGWGCMGTVPVYLHSKDEKTVDTVLFQMCDKTVIKLAKAG